MGKFRFRKLTMSTGEQLTLLVTVMLVRALFQVTGSYDSELIPESLSSTLVCMAWNDAVPWQCTVIDLCRLMKLNLFATDPCSNLIRRVMQETEQAFSTYSLI